MNTRYVILTLTIRGVSSKFNSEVLEVFGRDLFNCGLSGNELDVRYKGDLVGVVC